MASQELSGFDPFLVVVDDFLPPGFLCFPEVTFSINHDEEAFDAKVIATLFQFSEIFLVRGLVLEKLVHVFNGGDSEFLLGDPGEIEVGHFLAEERLVKGPLCERDIKKRL